MTNLVKKLRPLLVFFIVPVVLPLIIFLGFKYSSSFEDPKVVISGYTMGTDYSISIYSEDKISRKNINILKFQIDSILVDINSSMSTYDINSELSSLNNSIEDTILISSELHYVISKGIEYSLLSDGLYDITVLPLVKLWGFKEDKPSKPSFERIQEIIDNVGVDKIDLSSKDKLVKKSPNVTIDLASIAKGYAVDKISSYLQELGYINHLVVIGGEVKTKGSKLGEKWNVEITDPRSGTGYKTIELTDLSIATSGTYENYRTFADSIEYSHILNPKTGYPIKHNTVSATVIAPNCIDADALATASMSMNPLDAIKLIEDLEFEGLILVSNKNGELIEYKSEDF